VVEEAKLSSLLSEFAHTLLDDFPVESTLDRLVARIVDVLPVTGAGVTLIAEDGARPEYVAASDSSALAYEQLQTELREGPCVTAFESGAPVAVTDLRSWEAEFPSFAPAALDGGLGSVFTFPMRNGDRSIGALDLYRTTVGELEQHDSDVAQTLADVATVYLLNARARDLLRGERDQFQRLALHDFLTGLPNRALLEERLAHAASRAQRAHTIAAVLFADIDRFKAVNDTYGHAVGDDLLCAVARRLSGLVRPSDTLARISGDEFVFLCEELRQRSDVDVITSRIADAFDVPFVIAGTTHHVTVSIGVAFAGPGEQISRTMLAHADAAMYQAKRDGGAKHHVFDLRDKISLTR
jgi:diguanylate cyclase (GGDEF)-like protein